METSKKLAIIGFGGFAREVYWQIKSDYPDSSIHFFVEDQYVNNNMMGECFPLSVFDPDSFAAIIAIGNPSVRKRIVESMPPGTEYFSYIHSSAQLLAPDIFIGEGSIISPNSILTTNINIGNHAQLNLSTTIGHDCTIGEYFTTAPGAKVSGNCIIGDVVYLGTNSSIREKIQICSNVTIGLNSGVVKNILESGTYAGLPSKKIST